jgi:redox-sensitive bicupin YhaK (pirin superfamily)
MNTSAATDIRATTRARARRVAHRTRGISHGSITRLVSPSGVGELIKPFVFLDYFDIDPQHSSAIGFHPHSGIATLTLVVDGQIFYEETSGAKGIIEPGGVEWMRSGGGVWHNGAAVGTARATGYQLWVALPPDMESIESAVEYLAREQFQSHGPARVILGRYGDATSRIAAPTSINYLDVALKKGEKWHYEPPENHTVGWVSVRKGKLGTPTILDMGELAVFEESNSALEFEAPEDTAFILGSAVKHPYDLVLGTYSVHTNKRALDRGEAKIAEIGRLLRAEDRL